MRFSTRTLITLCAGILVLVPARATAQDLPDAKVVIARYVDAIHGDVVRRHTSMRTTGSFSLPAMGTTGQLEIMQARPNHMVMSVNLPGLGEIRSGFDGEVGWSMNPMEGPRLLTGKELVQQSDDAAFESGLRDASLITSMETVAQSEVEGTSCYKLRIVWKSGRETLDCYAVDTGLLIATTSRNETVMGTVEATMLYSDYREFDGFRMPTRTRQRVMNQEFVMTITSVEFGTVSKTAFEPPPEVRALLKN
jgi:hypothetical protein